MHGHVCGHVVIYGHLWSYLLIKPLKTLCFRNGLGDTVFTPFFVLPEHRFLFYRFQYVFFFPRSLKLGTAFSPPNLLQGTKKIGKKRK